MSEAIILYRGRGGVDPESLKPQTITSNGTYKAPVTGNYWVAVVGGGGGGGGGCRNSWNVSQVFYGAGGTRGTLNAGNVFLNAGDEVSVTLGAGGTAGVNNTTVVSNNSRGTNGGTGSTSAFGSYRSGAGGAVGGYSWSEHHWVNKNMGWNNSIIRYDFTVTVSSYSWNNTFYIVPNGSTAEWWPNYYEKCKYCGWDYCSNNIQTVSASHHIYTRYCNKCLYLRVANAIEYPATSVLNERIPEGISKSNTPVWSNRVIWSNKITNTTTRCYTSIQQGTWWYLNNNQVSTSGTRTYRSDGGASGSAGNAGFMVIIPPII